MIILDTETTGTQAWKHQIIQIAAFDQDTQDEFHRLLFFDESKAEPEALRINGYNPELWRREAVTQEEGRKDFLDFVRHHADIPKVGKSGKPYKVAHACAYNAGFDKDFLDRWMWDDVAKKRAFLPLDPKWIDPLQWCIALFPRLENHKLSTVCQAIGIPTAGAHDAMADVLMLAHLVYKIQPAINLGIEWCSDNLLGTQPSAPLHPGATPNEPPARQPRQQQEEPIHDGIPF